jgi:polar amino acid transport system ATP-binding protein
MSELMISVRNLHKSLGTNAVLTDISIDIFSQEVVVVIGPSGSGKSTFFAMFEFAGAAAEW